MKYLIGVILVGVYALSHSFSSRAQGVLHDAPAADPVALKEALAAPVGSDGGGKLSQAMHAIVSDSNGSPEAPSRAENADGRKLALQITPDMPPRDRLAQVQNTLDSMRSQRVQDDGLKLQCLKAAYELIADDPEVVEQVRVLAVQQFMVSGDRSNEGRSPASAGAEEQSHDVAISSYHLFLQTQPAPETVVETTLQAIRAHRDESVQIEMLTAFSNLYPDQMAAFKGEPVYQKFEESH